VVPPAPWPGPLNVPMPPLVTLDGSTLPAPTDGLVNAKPPTPPKPPPPPSPAPGPPSPPSGLDALVDKAYAGKTATELADAPVDALNGVTAADAQALHTALGIRTIADLGTNRYVRAAQQILAGES
jgi:hypothetical protein